MDQNRIDHYVEILCEKGCREVWLDIQRLEAGESVAEVNDLAPDERRAVLQELKDVMAVYGDEGCPLSAEG